MKYINLLILIALLSASWTWIHQERQLPDIVHAEIQNNIKKLISDYIQENLPTAENIEFHKVWTQTINNKKVKAFFKYSFDNTSQEDGNSGVLIDGYATLEKSTLKEKADVDIWTLQDIQILNNHLVFKDGININASDPAE